MDSADDAAALWGGKIEELSEKLEEARVQKIIKICKVNDAKAGLRIK
jgi:hypothetical protein